MIFNDAHANHCAISLQVNDTNLHEFLDNHEREFIFGNNPESEFIV